MRFVDIGGRVMQTHKSKNMWSEKSPKIKVFYHKSTVPVLLHNHDFYELIYIVDGMGVHTVDSVKYPLCSGSMAYIDAYVPHSISYADTLEYYDIVIGQPILQALGFDSFSQALKMNSAVRDRKTPVQPVLYFFQEDSAEILELIRILYRELNKKRAQYLDVVLNVLRILLIQMTRGEENSIEQVRGENDRMLRQDILDYVIAHYDQNLSMKELAEKYSYNPAYFSRYFKQHYGVKFSDFIRKKRIDHAIELLKSTTLSVDKISQTVGYQSKSQFYKMFRKVTGKSVSEFQKDRESVRKEFWNLQK